DRFDLPDLAAFDDWDAPYDHHGWQRKLQLQLHGELPDDRRDQRQYMRPAPVLGEERSFRHEREHRGDADRVLLGGARRSAANLRSRGAASDPDPGRNPARHWCRNRGLAPQAVRLVIEPTP